MDTYTHLHLVDTTKAVEALPVFDSPVPEENRQKRTGTYYDSCGAEKSAENGAVFGAERQEIGGIPCQPVTKCHDRLHKDDTPKTPVNRGKKKFLSKIAEQGLRHVHNNFTCQIVGNRFHDLVMSV